MSKIADDVGACIAANFKFETIIPEHYVQYKGSRLFFDFYIKSLGVCIEVQGAQHFKFVKQFHGTVDNFYAQKRRDNLKKEYCEEHDITLVFFYDKEDLISKQLVISRIYEAMNE